MSSTDNNKNIKGAMDINDLIQEIIDNSPIELTQMRIDTVIAKYYEVVDDILNNCNTTLWQSRIDNIDMNYYC